MSKRRILFFIGVVGLGLILVGAVLYAVNPQSAVLAQGIFIAGILIFLIFVVLGHRTIIALFKKRSSRYGANTILMIIVFTSILVIIQALSVRHRFRHDFTRNKRFTLVAQTVAVLDSLREDVDVYAFYQKGAPERYSAEDLFKQFAHRTNRFHYELIDPDQSPQKARDMDINTYGTTVVQAGVVRQYVRDLNEENLLNAVVRATRRIVKVIYFVHGHGEKDPERERPAGYSIAAEAIEKGNFEVRKLSLYEEESVPEDCAILVLAGPRNDYIESEINKIEEYLTQGRNAVFFIDPHTELPNIQNLLAKYRIVVNNDAVVDPFSRVFGGDYSVPVTTDYDDHPITRNFDVATFFPTARSLAIAETENAAVTIQSLARTGKSAWGETNLELIDKGQAVKSEEDNPAPLFLALVAEKRFDNGLSSETGEDRSKIVVIGDSDFASNSSFRLSGNADFFLHIIDFLAEEKDRIAVRAKTGLGDRLFLTASQGRFVFLVSVILLPFSIIAFGTSVWFRRRRRG